jgi:hypothetical protein
VNELTRRVDDGREQRRLEDALELMPRSVRDKLDRVGIKLHLAEWQMLTLEERGRLRDQVCEGAGEIDRYRADLEALVRARCGKSADRLQS